MANRHRNAHGVKYPQLHKYPSSSLSPALRKSAQDINRLIAADRFIERMGKMRTSENRGKMIKNFLKEYN